MVVLDTIEKIKEYSSNHDLCVALGYFDGVHLAHQKLLAETSIMANSKSAEACVLLIEPHPIRVLMGYDAFYNLITLEEKIRLIQSYGDFVICICDFTKEFAALSPENFVKNYLVDLLNTKGVVFGYNYTFGHKGLGKPETMISLCNDHGIETKRVKEVTLNGQKVSSTNIRSLIENGNILKAQELLGHNQLYRGKVINGSKIGRTIGFPTANIQIPSGLVWPGYGVYAGVTELSNGKRYRSVINIGTRPTVNSSDQDRSFEIHLIDFEGDLYGQEITVVLYDRTRTECFFPSLEALKAQIAKDVEEGRKLKCNI